MLTTRATKALGIDHPIVQAGMARGFSNASLVAAVSGAGGLGVLDSDPSRYGVSR